MGTNSLPTHSDTSRPGHTLGTHPRQLSFKHACSCGSNGARRILSHGRRAPRPLIHAIAQRKIGNRPRRFELGYENDILNPASG